MILLLESLAIKQHINLFPLLLCIVISAYANKSTLKSLQEKSEYKKNQFPSFNDLKNYCGCFIEIETIEKINLFSFG